MAADLAGFLRDCLDEDERDPGGWSSERVLAEVDAKRRIIAAYEDHARLQASGMGGLLTKYMAPELQGVLRLLALPYAAHPDYRPEWAPEA